MRRRSAWRCVIPLNPMHSDLIDLLPLERQNALAHEYLLRLGVVSLTFVTLLTLAAAVLLVPTYVLLSESARAKEAHLATIESTFSSAAGATFSTRLAKLSDNAAILSALARAPSASATLRATLAVARPGIMLSSLAYTPALGAGSGKLVLSGTAVTRDALRSYQLVLSSAPFAAAANLPVSAYAKDSNIAFSITVTLAP